MVGDGEYNGEEEGGVEEEEVFVLPEVLEERSAVWLCCPLLRGYHGITAHQCCWIDDVVRLGDLARLGASRHLVGSRWSIVGIS